jgi:hypothetical protein
MSEQETLRRLMQANPYPAATALRDASPPDAVLIALIEERTRTMSTTEETQVVKGDPRSPGRGPLVAAVALGAILLVAVALLLAGGDEPEVVEPVAPPVEQLTGEFSSAINRGDLEGALALLSPESDCNLPFSGFEETCEISWGFPVGSQATIGFENCGSEPPTTCTMELSGGFMAAMGYPNSVSRDQIGADIDPEGMLVIDQSSVVAQSLLPDDALTTLWRYMDARFPELDIDLTFGPSPYDLAAGQAALQAAQELNDPQRIADQLQGILSVHAASGLSQCTNQDGTRDCRDLMGFLQAISAELTLQCDPSLAADFAITCPMTIDSDVHRALGSDPTTTEVAIDYRGGTARNLEFHLVFADRATHDAFVVFAGSKPDLVHENGRPVWTGETGAAWVAAAEEFSTTN